MENNKSIRLRTTPGVDKNILVKLDQEFDTLDILSLKIRQEDVYSPLCANYGVVVGRVIANKGFGVPNAKVSVFIPISDEDKLRDDILEIYPYETVYDKNNDGIRYNLIPEDNQDLCHSAVGTFPRKSKVLDNDIYLEVYDKYYKYTTKTNNSGDYMIIGVPTGNQTIHVDIDLSDIGPLSIKPYDLINEGYSPKQFKSNTQFKTDTNLDSLPQIETFNQGVNVVPFWGNGDTCDIGITRVDFNINKIISPTAIFFGSIFTDDGKESINKNCRPQNDLGAICNMTTQEGYVYVLKRKLDGSIEYDFESGGRIIDENGNWATLIKMNITPKVTNEFGDLIDSNTEGVGVFTEADVRFKIGFENNGEESKQRTTANFLVPNMHNNFYFEDLDSNDIDFKAKYPLEKEFQQEIRSGGVDHKNTKNKLVDFYTFKWKKIYTIKQFIPRYQKFNNDDTKAFTGIKRVDNCDGDTTPFPFNRHQDDPSFSFFIRCFTYTFANTFRSRTNRFRLFINSLIRGINGLISGIFSIGIPVPCGTDLLPKPKKNRIYCEYDTLKFIQDTTITVPGKDPQTIESGRTASITIQGGDINPWQNTIPGFENYCGDPNDVTGECKDLDYPSPYFTCADTTKPCAKVINGEKKSKETGTCECSDLPVDSTELPPLGCLTFKFRRLCVLKEAGHKLGNDSGFNGLICKCNDCGCEDDDGDSCDPDGIPTNYNRDTGTWSVTPSGGRGWHTRQFSELPIDNSTIQSFNERFGQGFTELKYDKCINGECGDERVQCNCVCSIIRLVHLQRVECYIDGKEEQYRPLAANDGVRNILNLSDVPNPEYANECQNTEIIDGVIYNLDPNGDRFKCMSDRALYNSQVIALHPDADLTDTRFDGDAYIDCQLSTRADKIIEYEFYNDWINGSLYAPLFKRRLKTKQTKRKKITGEKFRLKRDIESDVFCDFDCSVDTLYEPRVTNEPTNTTLTNHLLDGHNKNICQTETRRFERRPYQGTHAGLEFDGYELGEHPKGFNWSTEITEDGTINEGTSVNPSELKITNGLVKEFDSELYYPSHFCHGNCRTSTDSFNSFYGGYNLINADRLNEDEENHKHSILFATNITELGSMVSDDVDGEPFLIDLLPDSSYDKITDVRSYFELSCGGISSVMANNITKTCQLGINIYDTDNNDETLIKSDVVFDVDQEIRKYFCEKFNTYRSLSLDGDLYTYPFSANTYSTYNAIPTPLSVSNEVDTTTVTPYDICGNIYDDYKLVSLRETPYYFYFGINKGKTSLDKLIKEFYDTCIP